MKMKLSNNMLKIRKSGFLVILFLLGVLITTQLPVSKAAGTKSENAELISLNKNVSSSIAADKVEDWYYFTTGTTKSTADSWFRLRLLHKNSSKSMTSMYLILYDKNEKEITKINQYRENEERDTYIKLAQNETYYVKLCTSYLQGTADYIFSVTELPDEANEKYEEAITLKKNVTNRFELQHESDVDWFYVNSNTLKPTITVKNPDVRSYFTYDIYDIDGIYIKSYYVKKGESSTETLDLKEKEFYIKVHMNQGTWLTGEDLKGKYTISVSDKALVSSIRLNRNSATLNRGKTLNLKATIAPSNAANKKVTWKTSNASIATVNSNGRVTARKKGTVTITCTATDGSGKKATCRITVR